MLGKHPITGEKVGCLMDAGSAWLSGGGVGPEGSIFSVGVSLVVIAALWRWTGTTAPGAGASENVRLPVAPAV